VLYWRTREKEVSLDLAHVVAQIEDLAASLKAREGERRAKLDFALETLQSPAAELDQLRQKIDTSKATWLVADLRKSMSSFIYGWVTLIVDVSRDGKQLFLYSLSPGGDELE
jgi:hypothetical protein